MTLGSTSPKREGRVLGPVVVIRIEDGFEGVIWATAGSILTNQEGGRSSNPRRDKGGVRTQKCLE